MDEGTSDITAGGRTVDMKEWVSMLERKRKHYVSLYQSVRRIPYCLISRVPKKILELDRKAYEPINLSIGPYHHGNLDLQILEEKKWRCLNYILRENAEKKLQDYLQLIEGLQQEARSCYPEDLVMESDEFIKMLLLDGCFVLVTLRGIEGTNLPASGPTDLSFESVNEQEIFEKAERRRVVEQFLEEPACSTKGKFALDIELGPNQFTDSTREDLRSVQQTKHQEGCDKPVQAYMCLTALLLHDLLLLENQIPFFVVKGIHELFAGECDSSKLADRIGWGLVNIIGYPVPLRDTCMPNKFHHLLHFWHVYLKPTEHREKSQEHHKRYLLFRPYFKRTYEKLNIGHTSDRSKVQKNIEASRFSRDHRHLIRWRRAEQYHEAGIHFQKREFSEYDRYGLLEIRFTNGLLEIPSLVISWHTGSFFKNIIALEQTCPEYGNHFTSYCAFLSQIVTKPADVALLARRGILVHHMRSDDEVSALLTKLGKNIDFDVNGSHYLKNVCRRMEEHYQNRVNRWMAWLWHSHFSNPWLSLAVLAAAIVLLCTILQTLFAFLAYFNPPEA